MKIKVYVIDLEIPPRVKRWALRIGIPATLIIGAGALAYASVPKTWATGDPLTASDLNANFAEVTTLAFDGGVYSVGPTTFIGTTAAKTPGDMSGFTFGTGYHAAKKACEYSFPGLASVHMCTPDELARFAQTNGAAPTGWYASGVYWEVTTKTPSTPVGDCSGWTSAGSDWGSAWYGTGNYPTDETCSGSYPILCCN